MDRKHFFYKDGLVEWKRTKRGLQTHDDVEQVNRSGNIKFKVIHYDTSAFMRNGHLSGNKVILENNVSCPADGPT